MKKHRLLYIIILCMTFLHADVWINDAIEALLVHKNNRSCLETVADKREISEKYAQWNKMRIAFRPATKHASIRPPSWKIFPV